MRRSYTSSTPCATIGVQRDCFTFIREVFASTVEAEQEIRIEFVLGSSQQLQTTDRKTRPPTITSLASPHIPSMIISLHHKPLYKVHSLNCGYVCLRTDEQDQTHGSFFDFFETNHSDKIGIEKYRCLKCKEFLDIRISHIIMDIQ